MKGTSQKRNGRPALHGPINHVDPYATEPQAGDWVKGLGAHLMSILPDTKALSKSSTDSKHGGPWVMWAETPFAHAMIPIDRYPAW